MAADSLIEASLFLSELVSHEDQLYGSNVANFRPLSSATANSDLDVITVPSPQTWLRRLLTDLYLS